MVIGSGDTISDLEEGVCNNSCLDNQRKIRRSENDPMCIHYFKDEKKKKVLSKMCEAAQSRDFTLLGFPWV